MTADFKYAVLTQKIIGVFYEVYNELGTGFLESSGLTVCSKVDRSATLKEICSSKGAFF